MEYTYPKGARLTAICKNCCNDRNDEDQLCENCMNQLKSDLEWMTQNLPMLEEYKINKINKNRDNSNGGGGGYTASAPLREAIYSLLYQHDDEGNSGIRITLTGFCQCLGTQFMSRTPCGELAYRILHTVDDDGRWAYKHSTATPPYAHDIRRLVKKARYMLEDGDRPRIILGACPNVECGMQLSAPEGVEQVKCRKCHNVWTVATLKNMRKARLMQSDITGTQAEIRNLLVSCGYIVNKNTMKSWVHRGQLTQVGENQLSKPVYRLADAYRLVLETEDKGKTITNIWDLVGIAR